MTDEWLIDGYNLLRSSSHSAKNAGKPLSRESLFSEIASFAAVSRRRIVIVLDGAGNDAEFNAFSTKEFLIRYSQEVSADAYIERRLAESPSKERCVVVSDDRAIVLMVRGMGARAMHTEEFVKALTESQRESKDLLFRETVRAHGFNRPFLDQLERKGL